jgi:hypothetical protein
LSLRLRAILASRLDGLRQTRRVSTDDAAPITDVGEHLAGGNRLAVVIEELET